MRFLSLQLENFGPFVGGFSLDLDRQGLVAVLGRNLVDTGSDVNGSGKSSILDAFMWGLFGETSPRKETTTSNVGLKSDDIVNDKVGKDTIVVVTFEANNGTQYRVRRWRKAKPEGVDKRGNGAQLFEVGVPTPLADLDVPEIQRRIEEKLGFDHELFSQTVMRSQEDAFTFAQATPKERFGLLTRVEGLEELDTWNAKFAESLRVLRNELSAIQGDVRLKEQALTLFREEAAREASLIQVWEVDRQNRVAAGMARVAQYAQGIAQADLELAKLPAFEAALAGLNVPAEALPSPPEGLQAWVERQTALHGQLGGAQRDYDRAAQAYRSAKTLQAGKCGHCGQALAPEYIAGHLAELEAEGQKAAGTRTALLEQLAEATRVIAEAQTAYAQVRAAAEAKRFAREQERQAVLSAIALLKREEANRHRLLGECQRCEQEVTNLRAASNPMAAASQARAQRVQELEAAFTEAKQLEGRTQTMIGLTEWWTKNLPSLKAWIFDSVVGEITREANRWLSILTGGLCWVEIKATDTTKAGETRDRVGLQCFRWNADGSIAERDFRRWSGGEKRRIALAIEWALAARLAQRSKASCSFLALDEVDRHLDAAGRAGLIAAFDVLRREKETILFVTQDADMRAKPDKSWIVTKDKAGARVEVVDHGEGRSSAKAA